MHHSEKLFKLSTLALCLAALPQAAQAAEEVHQAEVEQVTVVGKNKSLRTESQNSYTVSALRSTTGLVLSPREIPQSVSVITKKQIEDQGITDLEGALQNATGINVFKSGGRTHFMSRGYFIEQFEEDGIATQLGSPGGFGLGGPAGDPTSATDMAMYDHIEVVRGAAGLTQANNEPGGTVNAVRKKPTAKRQLSADLMANSWGKVNSVFDASGTLSQEHGLRGRFVGSVGSNKTFKDQSGGRDILLYGVMDKDIGDNSKLTWGASYLNQTETPDPDGLPMRADSKEWKRSRYLGADWNEARLKKYNLFTEFEHYFNDNWKLSSKLDWRKNTSSKEYYTLGGTGNGIGTDGLGTTYSFDRYDAGNRQFTFQNNLTGRIFAFGQNHDLFFMHSYSKENVNSSNRWLNDSSTYDADTFNGSEKARPDWDSDTAKARGGDGRYTTHAFGLGARINPTDKLHIIAGGRYTSWKRDYYWDRDLKDGAAGSSDSLKRNRFVPYAGITYDITPKQSIYAAYTSIFKQTMNRDYNDNLLPPIMGRNYEIGWKGEWFNRKLNTSVALFQIDQKNRSVQVYFPTLNKWYNENVGHVRSRGLDLEISGSLTENWKIFAGYTLNNSKYMRGENGRNSVSPYLQGANFSRHTPKHIFRLHTSYDLPWGGRKWTVGGGVSAQSKTSSLGYVKQGGYALWHANVKYTPSENLQFSLIADNLFNKRYFENNKVRYNGINNYLGEPRNISLKVDWKFK